MNSSFFFKCVKERKSKNQIRAIKDSSGQLITDPKDIHEEFVSSFKSLYNLCPAPNIHEGQASLASQWLQLPPRPSEQQIQMLNAPFTNEEIKQAVFSMKPIKSPGPDGISPHFIQAKWNIIKDDVCAAVQGFFQGGFLLKEMNRTFISLIPKVARPDSPSQFRPISLCNTSYKIISRCLVGRLRMVMKDIGVQFQNAFIPGRLMNDNILIAHELLNWVKHNKSVRSFFAILKIDLSKAYDRISWPFLHSVLQAYGFPNKWIHWILQGVTTVSYSVLLNGTPSDFFSPSGGLRQGDPLSPYLFILCIEILSLGLNHCME